MVRVLQGLVSVAGRIALSAIFLMSTLGYKIPNFNSAAQLMASKGIPAPRLMLVGAIVFLIVGSLSVIAGYKTRFGAALILVFLVLASYYFQFLDALRSQGPAGADDPFHEEPVYDGGYALHHCQRSGGVQPRFQARRT